MKIKLVIPITLDIDLSPFQSTSLKVGNSTLFHGLIEVTIGTHDFHIFKHHNSDTDERFLFIESLGNLDLDEFKKYSDAVILALGFTTGKLFLEEYYYMVLNNEEYLNAEFVSYEYKGESICSNSSILDPFGFTNYIQRLPNYESELKHINPQMSTLVLSLLISQLLKNKVFARSCSLVVEGNNCHHKLLKAGIYSIAIETITQLIYEENEQKVNPIPDQALAKEVRKKLQNCLMTFDDLISTYGKTILSAKIQDINKPTNLKKLTKPFEIYGIKLDAHSLEILGHRNKFLHSLSPTNSNQDDLELIYIALKLRFMLNSLILKYIGYSGHLVNNSAWLSKDYSVGELDHPFKLI